MGSERWQQVNEIFHAALASDPARREAFLADACGGDAVLRAEVEALVAAHHEAGPFGETPLFVPALSLEPGSSIGSYRVGELLGAGGMGEVYSARDGTLERDVAIKVLPQHFASDSERVARLLREARLLAALNHPNIAAIYGVVEADAHRGLVLEFVEGPTLAERIGSGGIPLPEALSIARQIADALDAAHRKGIIHRDLKPANIKTAPGGIVKVLDFGLAKIRADDAGGSADLPHSATVTAGSTRAGVILGTAAYMSPEQARGRAVDKRADLWSFGCVLYEMLTGRMAFRGESVADTIALILSREPDWAAVPETTPLAVRQMLQRCLERDPQQRLRDIGDVRNELDQALIDLRAPTVASRAVAKPVRRPRAAQPWLVAAGLLSVLVSVGAAFLLDNAFQVGGQLRAQLTRRAEPFQDFTMSQITETGRAAAAAISPDAKYVASVQADGAGHSVWLRNIATGSDTQIVPPAPTQVLQLAFSPDGDYVYFKKRIGPGGFDLYRVPVLGGALQLVTRDIDTNVTFSPDAQQIAWVRANDPEVGKFLLLSAHPDGSGESVIHAKTIETLGNNGFPRAVAWSNDGKRIAYSYGRYAAPLGTLHEFDLRAKRQNVLATVPTGIVFDVVWVARNRLLVLYSEKGPSFLRSQIGVLPAGADELRPVTRDTTSYSTLTVSADKTVAATVQQKTTRTLEFIAVSSRSGDTGSLRAPMERVGAFDWTADGHLLVSEGSRLIRLASDATPTTLINDVGAATLSVASCRNGYVPINWAFRAGTNGSAIWRVDRDGVSPKQLSPGPNDTSPVCTPDGKWAYYLDGLLTVMRVPVEGGQPEVVPIRNVPNTYEHLGGLALSEDGRQLVLIANTVDLSSSHEHDTIEVVDLHRDSALVPQVIEPVRSIIAYLYGGGPRFSPDKKSIVYATTENGVWNLWMQPLDGSPGRRITNFPSGRITEFRWSPDGKTLAVQRESDSSDVVLLRQRSRGPSQ